MSIAKKQDSLSGASNPGKVRGGGVEAPGGGVLWPEEKHALGKEAEGGMGRAGAYTFLSPWVTHFSPGFRPVRHGPSKKVNTSFPSVCRGTLADVGELERRRRCSFTERQTPLTGSAD